MNDISPASPDLIASRNDGSLKYLNVLMESWLDNKEEPNKVTLQEMYAQKCLIAQLSQREQIIMLGNS
jgi:hypothetical protein